MFFMKLIRSIFAAALLPVLCAALLAGCGTAGQTGEPSPDPAEGTESDVGAVQDAAYDEDALIQALDDCASIGPGSAGCSLRAVRAAGELVNFAALNWTDESSAAIGDRVSQWAQELDENAAAELQEGWALISSQAKAIADTPQAPDILAMLEEAGMPDLDLTDLDLSHTDALLACIREAAGLEETAA